MAGKQVEIEVEELRADLRRFITEEVLFGEVAALDDREPLISTGLIDSFYLLQLATHIEEAYGVRVPDEHLDPEWFDSLDELVAYVLGRAR